jgi:hypothetical protein
MAAGNSSKTIAIVVVAALLAGGLGYWGYGAYKTRELRGTVGTILKATAERMRDALGIQTGPAPENWAEVAKKLDGHAVATDKAIAQMRGMQVHRDRVLTDDADSYLVTVREILRRQAAMYRTHERQFESLQALRDHMRVDDRSAAWVRAAVRTKERAERDFREYRLATATYATLLGSFPNTQKKIEAAAGRENLAAPDQITRARERALATSQEADAEMEKARKLVGPK